MCTTTVTGVDFTLSDRVRRHVADKLGALDTYLTEVVRSDVTIHPMPMHRFRVDIQLHRDRGTVMAVHAEADSVYAAINAAAEKAKARLRRLHHKRVDHHARGAA